MEKINQITSGKAKSLYTTNDGNFLVMEFRDDTSAFDGKKTAALENKGKVNNQFNAFIMEFLESSHPLFLVFYITNRLLYFLLHIRLETFQDS